MIFQEIGNTIPYHYVTMINAYQTMCNKKGEPIENLYVDGLHINEEGYKRYSEYLKQYLLK